MTNKQKLIDLFFGLMRASVFHLKSFVKCLKELKFRSEVVSDYVKKEVDAKGIEKIDAEIKEMEADIKILEGIK